MSKLASGIQSLLDLVPIPLELLAGLVQDWDSTLRIVALDATEAAYGKTQSQYTDHLTKCGLSPSRSPRELKSRVQLYDDTVDVQLTNGKSTVELSDWQDRWVKAAQTFEDIKKFFRKYYTWNFTDADIYAILHEATLPAHVLTPDPPEGLTELQQAAVAGLMRWAMAARLGYMNVRKNTSDEVIGDDCSEQLPTRVAAYGGEHRVLRMTWEIFSVQVPRQLLAQGRGIPPLNFVRHPGPGKLFRWHELHRRALDSALKEVAERHGLNWLDVASRVSVLHFEWYEFAAPVPVQDAEKEDLNLVQEIMNCLPSHLGYKIIGPRSCLWSAIVSGCDPWYDGPGRIDPNPEDLRRMKELYDLGMVNPRVAVAKFPKIPLRSILDAKARFYARVD